MSDKILNLVPSLINKLSDDDSNFLIKTQAKHEISEVLAEIKYGRPACAQLFIDTLIAMAKKREEVESTKFIF